MSSVDPQLSLSQDWADRLPQPWLAQRMRRPDNDSTPQPDLGRMDNVNTHLHFNQTLGGQVDPHLKPQPDPRWRQSRVLPSPSMLSELGTPLRFENADPCPTVGAQTYFSTKWGPRNSTCHCKTREGHPETEDLISPP